jgi:hypothetical protein
MSFIHPVRRSLTAAAVIAIASLGLAVIPAAASGAAGTITIHGKVTISGSGKVGSTLTAHLPSTSPSAAVGDVYWEDEGNNEVDSAIPSHTYVVQVANVGHKLHARVIWHLNTYDNANAKSNGIKVVKGKFHGTAPKITGHLNENSTISAPSDIEPTFLTRTYTWLRNGHAIAGESSSTYMLESADVGKVVNARVKFQAPGVVTKTYTTHNTKKTQKILIATTYTPAITVPLTGLVRGSTLTASSPAWGPGTVVFAIQWYLNGKKVKGANSNTFPLGKKSVGKHVTVKFTGTEAGYATASLTSQKTAKVAKAAAY